MADLTIQPLQVAPATTRHQLVISIDPGASGGIAALKLSGEPVLLQKTPESTQDFADVFRKILKDHPGSNPLVVAELVTDRAIGDGSGGFQQRTGSGKLMYHAGLIEGIAVTLGLSFIRVQPNQWMTKLNCRTGVTTQVVKDGVTKTVKKTDKNITKKKAQELFPDQKFTHATADAMLIGEYARRQLHEGKL